MKQKSNLRIGVDVDGVLYDNYICTPSQVMPFSYDSLHELKNDGHKLYIISSRVERNTTITKDWLDENYGKNLFEKILLGCDRKGMVCRDRNIDIMIDDFFHYLQQCEKYNVYGLLMDNFLNRSFEETKYIKRVNDWQDAARYIKNGRHRKNNP
ncbi:MAG: 5' nucleotidase, NT5C type [bacterium]